MRNWRSMIRGEILEYAGDIDTEFHIGYGCPKGPPFIAFTKDKVFFPIECDGLDILGWAWRFKLEPMEHQ